MKSEGITLFERETRSNCYYQYLQTFTT